MSEEDGEAEEHWARRKPVLLTVALLVLTMVSAVVQLLPSAERLTVRIDVFAQRGGLDLDSTFAHDVRKKLTADLVQVGDGILTVVTPDLSGQDSVGIANESVTHVLSGSVRFEPPDRLEIGIELIRVKDGALSFAYVFLGAASERITFGDQISLEAAQAIVDILSIERGTPASD